MIFIHRHGDYHHHHNHHHGDYHHHHNHHHGDYHHHHNMYVQNITFEGFDVIVALVIDEEDKGQLIVAMVTLTH